MPERHRRVLFLLFFASGFCGLLYQVVWVRLAFAAFGVITPVLSVVISVFMSGLFAGSWLAGRVVLPLTRRTGVSAVRYYAIAELCVAVGAFAVPRLLGAGESWLLGAGETHSLRYLAWSALIIAGSIFPWCVFMGATFPLMMAFVKEESAGESTSFSFLYLANVIGAMAGTLVTALVLVEVLGFRGTLRVGACTNLAVAAWAALLRAGGRSSAGAGASSRPGEPPVAAAPPGGDLRLAGVILFATGFASMAMEVAWTRGFTPVLQTQVYSFATLLFTYLAATWLGSLRYRRHLAAGRVVPTARLVSWLALGAALPIVLNDPRLFPPVARAAGDALAEVLQVAAALLSILPFCAVLGYLTPKLVDGRSGGDPRAGGRAYAVNVLGCIVGPLVASYLLLPALGVKGTLVVLAAPFAVLLALLARGVREAAARKQAIAAVALLLVAALVSRSYEEQVRDYRRGDGEERRDHTATVIAYGEGMKKRLLVNGVGMTNLTTITKVMAHLPLGLVPRPRSALVICLGMGTTFRSLMTWGVQTTAVELVPSVRDSFPYFFPDAAEILRRPGGRVVIDDGRRFLRRTAQTFDVITLDPPPPVEAAGSSLLYSTEFYAAARSRLGAGGILQQWVPEAEDRISRAVARSLLESFPHVRMFRSHEGWGYHFLASMDAIEVPPARVLAARLPVAARQDLTEWMADKDPAALLAAVLAGEQDPRLFARGEAALITDDRPFNEYYLLRRSVRGARR